MMRSQGAGDVALIVEVGGDPQDDYRRASESERAWARRREEG